MREDWETANRSCGRTKETDGIRETAAAAAVVEKRNGRVMARAAARERGGGGIDVGGGRVRPSNPSRNFVFHPPRVLLTVSVAVPQSRDRALRTPPADSPEYIQFLESGWMIPHEALIIDPSSVSKLTRRCR